MYMNKEDISLIINCNQEDIKNIDISYFNDSYQRIYFNIKPNDKEYLDKIIDNMETEYYSIWDYNKKYKDINNINIIKKINNIYIIDNNFINSNKIYNSLQNNEYIIITENNNLKIKNLSQHIQQAQLNKIFCIYDEKNKFIILFHNLLYYFPVNYITFTSLTDIYNTINIYKLKTYILSSINNNIKYNLDNKICVHIIIHNINYDICNIVKYIKTYISDYIYVYDINSYDGIDYKLICSNYNLYYTFIENINNVSNSIKNNIHPNKTNIILNLIDDNDYSIQNITNIIYNHKFKNIHTIIDDNIFN